MIGTLLNIVTVIIGGGLGIIFKGSGFYVTDSKKSSVASTSGSGNGSGNGKSADSSGTASPKTETPKSEPAKAESAPAGLGRRGSHGNEIGDGVSMKETPAEKKSRIRKVLPAANLPARVTGCDISTFRGMTAAPR
mgnify:CR=1 FL=1